jgi:hypothetical protein
LSDICSHCGLTNLPRSIFCRDCGSRLDGLCPTCGQSWNGENRNLPVPVAEENAGIDKGSILTSDEPAQLIPRVKVQESLFLGLIYGTGYQQDRDCRNCGAVREKGRLCALCGFDGHQGSDE